MTTVFYLRGCRVDLARAVAVREGEEAPLSPAERRLLEVLLAARGAPVAREVLLSEALDYSPEVETQALTLSISRLRRKLERDPRNPEHLLTVRGVGFQLVGALAGGRTNLGREATDFIGRGADLAALEGLLPGPERGPLLVTLVAPGGMGKTRLARRFAARCVEGGGWRGGVWFCDLSQARDAAAMTRRVAEVLQVPLRGARTPAEEGAQVGAALRGRADALVLLDNLEQIEGAGEVVVGWLGGARLLATSRRALEVTGERPLTLAPLAPSEAAQLFVERARRVRADFALAPAEAEALARVVSEQLDGLPLAIELAAARAGLMTLQQISERLSRGEPRERLRLLRSGGRLAEPRHATLQAALDWSWELLSADERDALTACGVFRGAFDLAAASAVIGPEAEAVLAALERHSLVHRSGGERDLLVSVRDYARAALGRAPAAAALRIRHADHYLARAEALAERICTREHRAALEALAALEEHLEAAMERSLAPRPAVAARLWLARSLLWLARGTALAAEEAIAKLDLQGLPNALRGEVLRARAEHLLSMSRSDEARRALEAASPLAVGQPELEAGVLRSRAALAAHDGALAEMLRLSSEAIERARRPRSRAQGLRLQAISALYLGDLERAQGAAERGLALAREAGDRELEGQLLVQLSNQYKDLGDVHRCRAHLEQARALVDTQTGYSLRYDLLLGLANACLDDHELEAAEGHFREALRQAREAGDVGGRAAAAGGRAALLLARGDHAAAEEVARASMAAAPPSEIYTTSKLLVVLAHTLRARGALGEAVDALRRAAASLGDSARHRRYVELHLAAALADTGEVAEAAALLEGVRAFYAEVNDPVGLDLVAVGEAHLDHARGRPVDLSALEARAHQDLERRLALAALRGAVRAGGG